MAGSMAPRTWTVRCIAVRTSVISSVLLLLCVVNYGHCQEIRLTGGSTEKEGRLEIKHRGVWGAVVASRDITISQPMKYVVCRELNLGRPSGDIRYITAAELATSPPPAMLQDPRCAGPEPSLSSCYHSVPLNGSTLDAATKALWVKCTFTLRTATLSGGPDKYTGRMDVTAGAFTEYACAAYFDENAGNVACRQLGFGPLKRLLAAGSYGQSSAPLVLLGYKNIQCAGTELHLDYCADSAEPSATLQASCDASKPAAFECLPPDAAMLVSSRVGTTTPTPVVVTTSSSTAAAQNDTGSGESDSQITNWSSDPKSVGIIIVMVLALCALAVVIFIVLFQRHKNGTDRHDGATDAEEQSKPKLDNTPSKVGGKRYVNVSATGGQAPVSEVVATKGGSGAVAGNTALKRRDDSAVSAKDGADGKANEQSL